MDRSVGVSAGDGELGCYCDGEELETVSWDGAVLCGR